MDLYDCLCGSDSSHILAADRGETEIVGIAAVMVVRHEQVLRLLWRNVSSTKATVSGRRWAFGV